nr:anion permease [candidate division Zixibacteria bacterium]
MPKVLLVDDEDQFRESIAKRLRLREYDVIQVDNGEDAIKAARSDREIDVVLLDRKMPGMDGEQVLKELREFRPELQVIMLTAFASMESAMATGKLEAYAYMEKPCDFGELVKVIDSARADRVHLMARQEIPHVERGSFRKWLKGSHNSRPGIIILGIILFAVLVLMPTPDRLMTLLSSPKTGELSDPDLGYASYRKMEKGENVAHYYSKSSKMDKVSYDAEGKKVAEPLTPSEVATRAKIMLGVLLMAALFWASGAVPVGITALVVGVGMYFGGILQPDDIAGAYAKDAVIFIFGVLAMSKAIGKTGLDRRIGLLLLGPAKTLPRLLFIFLPLMAISCSIVSEHAMVAFIMPLFLMVYATSTRASGIKRDKALMVMLALTLCYTANSGGPGSPAAGGRNAIMMGILADYGIQPTFGQWVQYGMPFVPVMALVIATYFYFTFRNKIQVRDLNISAIVKDADQKIGPMNRNEYITAVILIGLIILWVTASDRFGMGGPVILAIVLLNIFRILRWRDIVSIPWDVVALYASASAIGKGLAVTGGALFMADSFINILPEFLRSGEWLAVAASLFTGLTTNFMSDGATVSAIGPITVPMAQIAATNPWMVGFATAFASSFAHTMIIGTPSNAIVYALAKDPITGEQLVTLGDFFRHGIIILLLSFVVLWGWTIFGYWRIIGF